MRHTFQRLSLGIVLILLASAILLLSDAPRQKERVLESGTTNRPQRPMRVAMFQMASQLIIDEGAAGVLEGLKEAGYVEGELLKLTRFNAEGDIATANAISQELVGGDYDLLITLTTGALQTVANANKQRKIPHVFGLVSDPIKAGVGVGTDPLDHPAHLVGIGTFPPVDQALALAKRLNPNLSRIGLAWNPAEINSEICTRVARQTCPDLKIELLESNVENTSAVKEAVSSLIDRRAEALLVGGDVTMLGAIEVVVKAGVDAHLPTITCIPGNAAKGSLFDVGANYFEVGRKVGQVAGRVLKGESIAKIPVEIAIPPKLFINQLALKDLQGNWAFPPDVISQADSRIDETGNRHDKEPVVPVTKPNSAAKASDKPLDKHWQVHLLGYVNSPDVEDTERGLRDGLKKSGLVENRDYTLKAANAQGDMSTLNSLVDAAIADRADLLMTISTQALQCSAQRARGTPTVFTMVANPFLAGVGKTETDHLPNVTGAYGYNDVQRMLPIIRQVMPKAKRIGALFTPHEVNSVFCHQLLADEAKAAGFELVSLGVNSPSEASDATQSLCDQHPDLLCLPSSNLIGSSYPTIAQSAARAKIPIFGFLGSMTDQGAVVVLTRDYYDMGTDSGEIAARVMRGEKPSAIPFHQSTRSKLFVNSAAARACGVTLPEDFLKSADRLVDK